MAAPGAAAQEHGTPSPRSQSEVTYVPDVSFTLLTGVAQGKMVFIGKGGAIDGVVNPTLAVRAEAVVQVTLINGEGAEHDVALPDFKAKSDKVVSPGASSTIVFRVGKEGTFEYFCTIAGHREAGMVGKLVVQAAVAEVKSIAQSPSEIPKPIGNRGPTTLRYELETTELEGRLMDDVSYTYWTFNGKVPGPFLRVRLGDTVEIKLKNPESSSMYHSIDLHSVNGPGGGATLTQTPQGEERTFTFKALNPGLYVYHCATPMVAHHIANGMYGLILVEPEGGLPPVDREFYVMQGEVYTDAEFSLPGHQEFNVEKLLNERPEYFVFNGSVGALTAEHVMRAQVGQTVRIFFGVGGPNYTSSFHVIGEIFDRVYAWADLVSPAGKSVQTVSVPAGGAAMVEFKVDVPGRYILVDHALSRLERGLVGFLMVDGRLDPAIYREGPAQ
ncbi:MAG: copper-containing nitrite reductase [Alphaproteobacteria bacterium]